MSLVQGWMQYGRSQREGYAASDHLGLSTLIQLRTCSQYAAGLHEVYTFQIPRSCLSRPCIFLKHDDTETRVVSRPWTSTTRVGFSRREESKVGLE